MRIITRQQKTEVRKAYRSKVAAVDSDGQLGATVSKPKKKTKDDGISVSMLAVEEVRCYLFRFKTISFTNS